MCGIGGIIGNIKEKEVLAILKALEVRGKDATGIAFNTPDWKVLKSSGEASEFIKLDVTKKTITDSIWQSNVCLLHTRQATHGAPSNNDNNHPIWSNKGIIIHNGVVSLTEKHEAKGETDTEQLLLSIGKYGIKQGLLKATGTMAIAYHSFKYPNFIYLYAHYSPLVIGKRHNNLYFCSTKNILEEAIGKHIAYYKVKENYLYRINLITREVSNLGEIHPTFNLRSQLGYDDRIYTGNIGYNQRSFTSDYYKGWDY